MNAISDLALSGDGGLLALQRSHAGAFVVRLAARLDESVTLWPMSVQSAEVVDINAAGTFAANGGDNLRAYSVPDGNTVWFGGIPASISYTPCLTTPLRFSPSGRWTAGAGYGATLDVFPTAGDTAWQQLVALPAGCGDTVAFSPDETLMATSTPALYRTGSRSADWQPVWAHAPPPKPPDIFDPMAVSSYPTGQEVRFSPDGTRLLVSRCAGLLLGSTCDARFYAVADGTEVGELPALTAPHPAFSPEGHWVVAGSRLVHLPSQTVRSFDDTGNITVAIFAPAGDIIAGGVDQSITRYCRSP